MSGASLDADLQKKYISAIKKVFTEYFVPPSEGFVSDIGAALLLKNSSVLLAGSPGVGKTTLLRLLAYELTGKPESLAVVTCTEDLRPEDFIYEVDIAMKLEDPEERLTRYTFTPSASPFLTSTFVLVNEINRLSPRTRNALLSVTSEGHISFKRKLLNRVDGIIMMDMNPSYGSLEWAFIDRIRAHLTLPALELGEQLQLFRKKYGSGRHTEDLVAYAMRQPGVMDEQELFRVWSDVDRVVLDEKYASNILLFTNIFSSCKYPLSTTHSNFKLPCDTCQYKELCVTRMLEHPVLTRSIDHVAKMLKAQAYFNGRGAVDLQSDIMPTLRRTILHRLAVKAEFLSQ